MSDTSITGYLNFNMLNNQTTRKINAFCEQVSLSQCISEPTHFTESSSPMLMLDILLVKDKKNKTKKNTYICNS